ncbi:hypothetical protein L3X38_025071 [Prunus dulcis]|uniref:Uncharacterized protein n=1 Tax=Prunus dulcis TaxID=3755 RepID=A0AAD4W150_PRUDU|nr:hypothetical protein L3X38_025071 [Prunus dulcis]
MASPHSGAAPTWFQGSSSAIFLPFVASCFYGWEFQGWRLPFMLLRLAYAERQQERRMGIGRMRTMGVKEEEKPMLGLEISVKPRAR